MMFPRLGVLVLLVYLPAVLTQGVWSVANLTKCDLSCLAATVPEVHCALTDFACQCESSALPALMSSCLIENCSLHDELVMAKVEASTCGFPHPNRSAQPLILAATVYAFTTVLILLRLVSKIWISKTMGTDDWLVIIAHTILLPPVCFTIKMAQAGFGKHLWDLQDGDLIRILRDFYIAENGYVVSITLTKISVLCLYLRLFQKEPWFRYTVYASIATIATSTVVISSLTIFACHPVQFFWNRDIHGGTCMNYQAVAYAGGSSSIVHDLLIVALPLPVLAKLNMNTRKKLGIAFMIGLGSLGCIVSMVRLRALITFSNSHDPSCFDAISLIRDNVDAAIWTILELAAAIICASLPALRVLFIHVFHASKLTNIPSNPFDTPKPKPNSKSSDFAVRRADQTSVGLIELRTTNSDHETPPKVPEKDVCFLVDVKSLKQAAHYGSDRDGKSYLLD